MGINSTCFDGEGMQRVYENSKWTVGIKNYKPANDIGNIDNIERHNGTDELFVLLAGSCTLVYAEKNGTGLKFSAVKMEQGKLYTIPRSLWHNTVTAKGTKMILIEDSSTGMDNSDVKHLSPDELKGFKAAYEKV